MRHLLKHLILLFVLLFLGCDSATVPRGEYDALLAEKQEVEAINDSLEFEVSSLKVYVECLEEENGELEEELRRTPVDRL